MGSDLGDDSILLSLFLESLQAGQELLHLCHLCQVNISCSFFILELLLNTFIGKAISI